MKIRTAEIHITSNASEVQTDINSLSSSLDGISASPIDALTSSNQRLTEGTRQAAAATRESGQAVLANGGAIALLDAATGGMASVIRDTVEASGLFTNGLKLQTVWQGISSAVIGGTTGALKLFRIALVSTGIGAIVVGLGLLIANFSEVSEWVQKTSDRFGGWRNVLMFIAPPIYLIIKALEALGIIETEAEEKSRKAWEARQKRNAEATKATLKQRQAITDIMDFEIAKANALGKNTVILEQVKREAILNTAKAYNDLNRALINSGEATQDQIKAWNANQELINKTKNEGILADLRVQKLAEDKAKEARDKANEDAKKSAADRKAAREKAAADELAEKKKNDEAYKNAQIKLNKELQDLQDITDQQKLDRQKARYIEEINALKGKTAEEKAILIASLDDQFKIRQADLDRKTAEEAKKAKEDADKKELDRLQAIQNLLNNFAVEREYADAKSIEEVERIRIDRQNKMNAQRDADILEAETLGATHAQITELRESYYQQEKANAADAMNQRVSLENTKFDLIAQAAQKGMEVADSLEKIGILKGKEAQKIQKALTLAQIGADTASAISSLVKGSETTGAAAGPAYLPVKFATFAAGIIPILANIAKAKQLLSSSGGGGGGGGGASASVSVPSIAQPSVAFQNTPQGQVGESIQQASANRNAQPIQVQVSSNEITNAQRVDSETISNARYN